MFILTGIASPYIFIYIAGSVVFSLYPSIAAALFVSAVMAKPSEGRASPTVVRNGVSVLAGRC